MGLGRHADQVSGPAVRVRLFFAAEMGYNYGSPAQPKTADSLRGKVLGGGRRTAFIGVIMVKRWQFWLGVAISAVFVYLALKGLDLDLVWHHIRTGNYF